MRVPGYGMLDLTAWWQVAKNVRINGGVYNITDRQYWDYLSSRNIETSTNQDAYDKALATCRAGPGNWASTSISDSPENNKPHGFQHAKRQQQRGSRYADSGRQYNVPFATC